MKINLSNSAGRSAIVTGRPIGTTTKYRLLDANGNEAERKRVCVGGSFQPPALDNSDLNLELVGRYAEDAQTAWLRPDGCLAKAPRRHAERVNVKTGEITPVAETRANINTETPLRTGTYVKIEDALRKYVFSRQIQIVHTNALEYDFLMSIAATLHDSQQVILITQGKERLVFIDGGLPYAAFLHGQLELDNITVTGRYILRLLLTNQELKRC
jgi:hypothetical protein